MIRLRVALAVAFLLVAGAYTAHDVVATRYVRDALERAEVDDLLAVGRMRLVAPDELEITDVRLRDGASGEEVVRLDRVWVTMSAPWLDILDAYPIAVRGRGGRISCASVEGGRVVASRAIEALYRRLASDAGDAAWDGPVPTVALTGIELAVVGPGVPVHVLEDVEVTVVASGGGVTVDVEPGRDGGRFRMDVRADGTETVTTDDLVFNPSIARLVPEHGGFLAHALAPTGRIDFSWTTRPGGPDEGTGRLIGGSFDIVGFPWRLERCDVPFRIAGGRVVSTGSRAHLHGEPALVRFDCTEDRYEIGVDIDRVAFHGGFVDLFPETLPPDWFHAEDGGNLELHMTASGPNGSAPVVSGWGGVWVQRAELSPWRLPFTDLVGAFELEGSELRLRETSARCAGGEVTASGVIDLASHGVDLEVAVQDVDVRELAALLDRPGRSTGWLEGRVRYTGVIGTPGAATGGGRLSVRAGNLWDVPLFERVLGVLDLTAPESGDRHRLDTEFEIRGRSYRIHRLELESDVLTLHGKGRVRPGFELSLTLVPLSGPGPLRRLAHYLQRKLVVSVEVTGPWDDPDVTVIPVEVVSDVVGTVLAPFRWLVGFLD